MLVMASPSPAPPASPLARYRRVLGAIRAERGECCEACGVPARSGHHVNAVGSTGIASELVFEPGNIVLLCNDCHSLCHPLRRSYPWFDAAKRRGKALSPGGMR